MGESEPPVAAILRLVEGSHDFVGVTDDSGKVVWLNPAARRYYAELGFDPDALTTFDMYPAEAFDLYHSEVRPVILRGETWIGDVPVYMADGSVGVAHQTVVGLTGPGGEVRWLATLSRHLPTTRAPYPSRPHTVSEDELTGLPMRARVREHLASVKATSRTSGEPFALLFVDLDGFKQVNDHYGHELGDRVLAHVAQRLSALVRPTDLVARWGGDEFVFIVTLGESGAGSLARRILEALHDPVVVDEHSVHISASIGIVEGAPENELEDLARIADSAMYHAKLTGGGGYSFSYHGLDNAIRQRRAEGRELAMSVTRGDIDILYQPIIEVATGRVLAAMAAPKWQRDDEEIAGVDLAATAEGGGVAVALGWQIIRDAVNTLAAWFRQLGPNAPVAHIPVMHDQLHDGQFAEGLSQLVTGNSLPAEHLCLDLPVTLTSAHLDEVTRLL